LASNSLIVDGETIYEKVTPEPLKKPSKKLEGYALASLEIEGVEAGADWNPGNKEGLNSSKRAFPIS
jgi:hypothetical protein